MNLLLFQQNHLSLSKIMATYASAALSFASQCREITAINSNVPIIKTYSSVKIQIK